MSTETEHIINKALNGFIGIVCTVAIAIAGFALKESYSVALTIRELSVKVAGIENKIESNTDVIYSNKSNFGTVRVLEAKMDNIQDNIQSIKADIKELAKQK